MSIEEIFHAMLHKDSTLAFRSLMSEVESECAALEGMLQEGKIFHRFPDEGFRLERGHVKVIVNMKGHGLSWTRTEEFGIGVLPVRQSEDLGLQIDCYTQNGATFSSMSEAARFLIEKLNRA
jgi:hypothetical protein